MYARTFEELNIWLSFKELSVLIYSHFKTCNDYGFKDQIQRAAVSVMNNIAEGFERESKVDFARFLLISKASSGEVRSMLYLANKLNYLTKEQSESLITSYKKLSTSIQSLRKSLLKYKP
jgi:four helix bundle protein